MVKCNNYHYPTCIASRVEGAEKRKPQEKQKEAVECMPVLASLSHPSNRITLVYAEQSSGDTEARIDRKTVAAIARGGSGGGGGKEKP